MQTSLDHVGALINSCLNLQTFKICKVSLILKILMNPQLRPLDSDANLDIFWPHFVCNSSACTSWLWIGIRYLSNWSKFTHLTWNIKFCKYSYSHSISTDYSIITRGVTMIFFSQARTKKQNLNWTNLFANGSSRSASENDQSFIFHNRRKQNKHLWKNLPLDPKAKHYKPLTLVNCVVWLLQPSAHALVFLNLR